MELEFVTREGCKQRLSPFTISYILFPGSRFLFPGSLLCRQAE